MGKLTLVVGAFFLMISTQAFAWGDLGHGTIGYMADKNLTPRAKSFVYSILGAEPLMTSSTWPDLVRSDDRYKSFAPYHFFDIPPGMSASTIKPQDRHPQDADVLISQAPRLLRSHNLSQAQKIVLLRYLVHVIEDVHQPLHIGNGIDEGANLCDVKIVNPSGTITKNLHSVWDETLVNKIADEYKAQNPTFKYFGYKELGDSILQDAPKINVNQSVVQKDKPAVWYNESQALHSVAYPDGAVTDPATRTYCKIVDSTGAVVNGKYDANTVPTLTDQYLKTATDTVKKRMLTAAYRLAAYLDQIAAGATTAVWTPNTDTRFFAPILLKNSQSRVPQSQSANKQPPFRDPHE